ncbi:phosphoribosyltransferase [Neolewinella antarctica]|uniref:Hypoxanthine phosphoribosyltransferase n=1 Tax=Neolewinella antarctica TaxID=442734 RepID=A0ABX0X9Q4_9BACT|nr:phosphoribosyltransferase family protein [Neolewinella antarctica]NJC25996.1 hypoxanthine phosphoribosyltransferase [Neolewinella antarctica]
MAYANPARIKLHEHQFVPFLTPTEIQLRVVELGQELALSHGSGKPSFLVMLKGAFIFAADLIRASGLGGEIGFVRTQSYKGTETSGEVRMHIAPEPELVTDQDVILIEDIIDSGNTMQAFLPILAALKPRSVTVVTLLHKPEAQQVDVQLDLAGFVIPPKFVVGYGLDYDGLGRQLPGIYQLAEDY